MCHSWEDGQIVDLKEVMNSVPLRGTARLKFIIFETCFEHGPSYRLENDAIPPHKAPYVRVSRTYRAHTRDQSTLNAVLLARFDRLAIKK